MKKTEKPLRLNSHKGALWGSIASPGWSWEMFWQCMYQRICCSPTWEIIYVLLVHLRIISLFHVFVLCLSFKCKQKVIIWILIRFNACEPSHLLGIISVRRQPRFDGLEGLVVHYGGFYGNKQTSARSSWHSFCTSLFWRPLSELSLSS